MSPSALISKLQRRQAVMAEVVAGLNGRPFWWGSGEASAKQPLLSDAGIILLTRTGVGRAGLRLKRGVKPVGCVYYNAPIHAHCAVYVLQCQTAPAP